MTKSKLFCSSRLFEDYLDDTRLGRLERDEFMRCAIVFYRVSRPSVDLVQTMGVAQGKLVRKLDVNEILELIEGPIKEINKVATKLSGKSQITNGTVIFSGL